MLTSTLAGMLLQLCPSLLRPPQTTDNAKGDRQGSRATTKDVMGLTKDEIKMKKQTLPPFVNKIVHFAVTLTSFKKL
jgi:hypothetical protein